MSTNIIATIGPSSNSLDTLNYFAKHGVKYARLNLSHGDSNWHREVAGLVRQVPNLELLLDLSGPKIRLGKVEDEFTLPTDEEFILELTKEEKTYPYVENNQKVLPVLLPIYKFAEAGKDILFDDGKCVWKILGVEGERIRCKVSFGGIVKSNKGINMPGMKVEIPFMTDKVKTMLTELLVELKPEVVAASFVKSAENLNELRAFMDDILEKSNVSDYYPIVCPKLETQEAMDNLPEIIAVSDLAMIGRGDLALQTLPNHVMVPFYQEKIIKECRAQNKPFVVATQALESMMESPIPLRSEVSDVFRSVVMYEADFIMLSGETATGSYPKESVNIMYQIINQKEQMMGTNHHQMQNFY